MRTALRFAPKTEITGMSSALKACNPPIAKEDMDWRESYEWASIQLPCTPAMHCNAVRHSHISSPTGNHLQARTVAGMINNCGIIHPPNTASEGDLETACNTVYTIFRDRDPTYGPDSEFSKAFREAKSHKTTYPPIRYVYKLCLLPLPLA